MSGLANEHFQGYVIRECIGTGGVAEVYRATHNADPERQAAVKIIRADKQRDRAALDSLTNEFAILGTLTHPGIPRARRQGELHGRSAVLMDHLPGSSLSEVMRGKQPLAPARTILALLEIVAYVHDQAIVHNDLKLENVIRGPTGSVSLIDFGSARPPARTSMFVRFFRRPTTCFGTAAYLAPELITGHNPSLVSDVYALGICIYILLTGSLPFAAEGRTERLSAHLHAAPLSIAQRLPHLPKKMAKVIDAALEKVPMSRPPHAGALRAALEGLTTVIDAASPFTASLRRSQRSPKPS